MRRFAFGGSLAILTGAASGIGRATALELARRGCDLVLVDGDAAGLQTVRDEIASVAPRCRIETHVVDLADRDVALATAVAIREAHPAVDILVNNAGVALGGRLDQVSLDDIWPRRSSWTTRRRACS